MKIRPFKIKESYAKDYAALELAEQIMGTAIEKNFSSHLVNGSTYEYNWKFYDAVSVVSLHITQSYDWYININYTEDFFGNGNTINVGIKDHNPDWKKKLINFVKLINKPWDEWTIDELIVDPMWIYYFQIENSSVPDQLHNAMVLFSYQEPNNDWVKRYFDASKKQKEASQK